VGVVAHGTLDHFKHTIDIAKHVVVPESQYAVAVRLESLSALGIRNCRRRVLTAVDLHDEPRTVTREVDDVLLDPNLPAEMRIADRRR
jgi:hypothetical protein